MSLVHALFVPKGTISKSGFAVAAVILIAVGLVSDAIEMALPALGPVLFFLALVLAYCWVVAWIKRLHAAGASGWWTVLVVFLWLVAQVIAGSIVLLGAGLDPSLFAGGDNQAIQAAMEPVVEAATVPILIVSTLISAAFAFGLNAVLPAGRGANRANGESDEAAGEDAAGSSEGRA
ncbi:MAG: hypothetical protein RIA71_12235 [Oceanicaulis sp.]